MIRGILILLLLPSLLFSQHVNIELIKPETDASFRGLSVIDDKTIWVSGSKGFVGKSIDGGKTWRYDQVPGFQKFDFRSIYAFNSGKAVIANAGAPSNILLTTNGGKNWKVVYTNTDTSAFIDGIDFWNEREGFVYGDPIEGRMLLLKTIDGGLTWKEVEGPLLENGEASFAASGTNIRCFNTNEIIIATGGKVSRLWYSKDKGSSWMSIKTPILQGEPATGIFSLAYQKPQQIIIVGGNYTIDSLKQDHVFYSMDMGLSWTAPLKPTRGYRESVEFLNADTCVSAGPSGIDIAFDNGITWQSLSDEKYFHVVRIARKGSLVVMAGGKGKLAILRY